MADEASQTAAQEPVSEPQGADTAAPTVEELAAQVADLQAQLDKATREGRKHEDREKANRDKARRAGELEAQAVTQAGQLAALQERVARYEARDARRELVGKVAEATGVPAGTVALLAGDDEEQLTKATQSLTAWADKRLHARAFRQ